jgi:YD repeat-containing protein
MKLLFELMSSFLNLTAIIIRVCLILSFNLIIVASVYCQTDITPVKQPVFASPEASAINKFIDTPVDFKSGLPQISIPLFTLENKDISIPVSLQYHASIKVRDVASPVGLGWSLIGSGVVTRVVNGRPGGGFSTYSELNNFETNSTQDQIYRTENDPDFFTYSYPGSGGKFFEDPLGKLRTIPAQNIDITFERVGDENDLRSVYVIRDQEGFVYEFGEVEYQTITSSCPQGDWWTAFENIGMAYYLTKITSPSGRKVEFEYKTYSYSYYADVSSSKTEGSPPSNCWSKSQISEGKVLQRIVSDNGYQIYFDYENTPRADLPSDNNLGRLKDVTVFHNGAKIKKFTLSHKYITCSQQVLSPANIPPPLDFYSNNNAGLQRLFLDKVNEEGIGDYSLTYNLTFNPGRFHLGVDHWGHYNGVQNNNSMIPGGIYGLRYMDGANRESSLEYMTTFLIKSMEYPTGGKTEFTFDAHKINLSGTSGVVYETKEIVVSSVGDQEVNESIVIPNNALSISLYYWTNSPNTTMITPVLNEPFSLTGIYWINGNQETGFTLAGYGSNSNSVTTSDIIAGRSYNVRVKTLGQVFTGDENLYSDVATYIKIKWLEDVTVSNPSYSLYRGSPRIARISHRPQIGQPTAKEFKYEDQVTGQLFYDYNVYNYNVNSPLDVPTEKLGRGSNSLDPIRPVYYKKVTQFSISGMPIVEEGAQPPSNVRNGKSEFYYSSEPSQKHFQPGTSLYAETDNRWMGGDLVLEKHFESVGQVYRLLESKQYKYVVNTTGGTFGASYNKPWEYHFYGIKSTIKIGEFNGQNNIFFPAVYHHERFELVTGFKYLSEQKTIKYKDGLQASTSIVNFEYNPLTTFLSKESQTDGIAVNSNSRISLYTRVVDAESSEIVLKLKAKRMLNNLIEVKNFNRKNTMKFTGGFRYNYNTSLIDPDSFIYVDGFSKTELNVPVVVQSINTLNFNVDYIAQEQYSYDERHNLNEVYSPANKQWTSYIYSSESDLPVASAVNTPRRNIFYEGFESSGIAIESNGNVISKTGMKVWLGVYTIPATFNPELVSNLRMNYWYFNNNKWNFSGDVTFSQTIGVPGQYLDDLRVFPEGAQMKTYTYKPGQLMTSSTDANNQTTYYEYDNVGRLSMLRDNQGNIVKQYLYNYIND